VNAAFRADTKVSTTPSSNGFTFTFDGICVSHLTEPDMRKGQFTTLEDHVRPPDVVGRGVEGGPGYCSRMRQLCEPFRFIK
jgi:hypothetical protein